MSKKLNSPSKDIINRLKQWTIEHKEELAFVKKRMKAISQLENAFFEDKQDFDSIWKRDKLLDLFIGDYFKDIKLVTSHDPNLETSRPRQRRPMGSEEMTHPEKPAAATRNTASPPKAIL